jgi:branched-chain amino acid transport system substrate-binding protein
MKRIALLLICTLLIGVVSFSASAADPIVVGFITALTGSTSLWGTQERNGAVLAADEINAKGGVLGRQIKLIVYDHKGQPAEGVSAYRRLVDQDKAVVVGGTHFSNISLAIAPVAEQKRVPIIGQAIEPKVTVPEPGKVNRYTFLAQPSSAQQGQMMARFGYENLGLRKAAVLADKSNSYSTSQAEAFAETFKALGGEVVSYIEYAGGTMDFKAFITQIKSKSPDVMFLPQYAQAGGLQVRQSKELGLNVTILGSNSLSDQNYIDACGGIQNAAGTYHLFNVNFDDPKFAPFHKAYEAKYGEPVQTYHTVFGYDDIYLIADAITRAGKVDPEAIRDALETIKGVPVLAGDGMFTMNPATHQPVSMPSWIFRWAADGSRVPERLIYPVE